MAESEREVWRQLPFDPEPADLGYDLLDLDITESTADGGHYVILPRDEGFLREDAFIVASSDAVCDLGDRT